MLNGRYSTLSISSDDRLLNKLTAIGIDFLVYLLTVKPLPHITLIVVSSELNEPPLVLVLFIVLDIVRKESRVVVGDSLSVFPEA